MTQCFAVMFYYISNKTKGKKALQDTEQVASLFTYTLKGSLHGFL